MNSKAFKTVGLLFTLHSASVDAVGIDAHIESFVQEAAQSGLGTEAELTEMIHEQIKQMLAQKAD